MKRIEPTLKITDPRFQWTSACNTDISKRFAAERERLKRMEVLRANNVSHLAVFATRQKEKA